VPGLLAGPYRVVAFNTASGVIVAHDEFRHPGGVFSIAVQPFVADIALAITVG
jgi:hypothetical protein